MKTIKDKKLFALSTLLCLLPIAMYLLVYDQLPAYMVQHWGAGGNPTWAMQKQLAIFAMPLMLTAVHIVTVVFISKDPKVQNNPKKIQHSIFWLVPVISIFTNLVILIANLDANFDVRIAAFAFIGLLFIIIGNYLPKTRQNYFIGVRTYWTLHNTDNWNKTHRLAGKTFLLSGFLFLLGAVLMPNTSVMIALVVTTLVLVAVIPITYSYRLYHQQENHDQ